jgi:serine/threonine protein kinase
MNDPTPHQPDTVDPALSSPLTVAGTGTDGPATDLPKPASGTEPKVEVSAPQPGTVVFQSDTPVGTELPPAPTLTIPGYEILSVLGHGGMGVVYKAREVALDRLVALKVVTAGTHASAEQLDRFRGEARAEARLRHPHIVQVHAVGEHQGCPYLSLEYMDGGNLAQRIARQPQPPREAAQLIYLLARAMAYAHQHGIIHRDLKPANILLQQRETTNHTNHTNKDNKDKQGSDTPTPIGSSSYSCDSCDSWFTYVPKIADFGLAKTLEDDSGHTRTGSLLGTPGYMSPEQAGGSGKGIGPATDLWALGIILYELLVGRPPFQGVTMMETLEQVRTREPVPPTQLQPKVPTDLETICLKCLRKEPNQRYGSAEALAEDLRRFLAGEPILARPVGSLERLTRWCRRNPRLAVLNAAVLLLLLTVAVGATVFAVVLDARQRETDRARQDAVDNATRAHEQEQRADENARIAQDRQQLALSALRVVIDKVQNELKTLPGTGEVRRDILESAMRVLRESVAGEDRSGLPDRGLASAHNIMGEILLEQGKRDEAIPHFNEAHAILEQLYQANPHNDKAAGNYAVALWRQGDLALELRNDVAEAIRLFRRALQLQEKSLTLAPQGRELTTAEIRRNIARSYHRLGQLALRADPDNLAEAEEYFQKARDLFEEVIPAENTPDNHRQLGQVAFDLAVLSEKKKQPEIAQRAYDLCLAMRKKLVEDSPSNTRYKLDVVDLCGKVGDQALFRGDTESALRYYRETIAPNEQLAKTNGQPGIRKLLGLNYYRLATAYLRRGDTATADEQYKKCLEVRTRLNKEIPNNTGLEIELMLAQARCGQHAEATAWVEKLRQKGPKNPEVLFQVACGYALSVPGVGRGKSDAALTTTERAVRQHYTDSAIAALRQAKANGYKDVHNLQIEPDLDPIREDKGFQTLMREYGLPSPESKK